MAEAQSPVTSDAGARRQPVSSAPAASVTAGRVKPRGTAREEAPANETTVRLVLADDHPIFREGLRKLLESEPGFAVVGEAADGHEALRLVNTLSPDLLLLDLAMPGLTGLEVLREVADSGTTSCRVMLLTAAIDREQTIEALRLGARGVVPKESATALLFKGIREVMKDQYWVGRESVSDVIRHLRQPTARRETAGKAKFGLTVRELQVVAAVVAGYSNKDIAQRYSLSADTVKHHLSSIFDKSGVSSRLELALFAINHGLVDRDQAV